MRIDEAALRVLYHMNRWIKTKELVDLMEHYGYWDGTRYGKTPESSVRNCLNEEIRKNGIRSRFMRIDSKFNLSSWCRMSMDEMNRPSLVQEPVIVSPDIERPCDLVLQPLQ